MIVNKKFVEEAIKTNKPIKVAHSLNSITTYEPTRNSVLVKVNGKPTVAIDRKTGLIRYINSYYLDIVNPDGISRKEMDYMGIEIKLTLKGSYYNVRVSRNFKKILKITKDPLVSAYAGISKEPFCTSEEAITFSIPVQSISIITPETLFKCALVFDFLKQPLTFLDVNKIAKTPLSEVIKILHKQAVANIPFYTQPPLYYANESLKFYSMNYNYVVIYKNGKVKKTFCGDIDEFCETVKLKFEEVMKECLG